MGHRFGLDEDLKATVVPAATQEILYSGDSLAGASMRCLSSIPM
jgi:hypothetical protein